MKHLIVVLRQVLRKVITFNRKSLLGLNGQDWDGLRTMTEPQRISQQSLTPDSKPIPFCMKPKGFLSKVFYQGLYPGFQTRTLLYEPQGISQQSLIPGTLPQGPNLYPSV